MAKRRPRNSRRTAPLQALRLAIDCMPVATREAMLDGVRESDRIIAGAYVDEHGGVCPMLAAHRRGGRTDFISFARSWDRFTNARGKARPATEREIAILSSQLQDSLEAADGLELDKAIAEHRRLLRRRLTGARRALRVLDPRGEIRARRLRSAAADAPASDGARERRPAART